jgi:hypothetical protein
MSLRPVVSAGLAWAAFRDLMTNVKMSWVDCCARDTQLHLNPGGQLRQGSRFKVQGCRATKAKAEAVKAFPSPCMCCMWNIPDSGRNEASSVVQNL